MNIKIKGLKLEWNVLNYDWNDKCIKRYNIIRQDLIDKIITQYRKKELNNIEDLKKLIKDWAFYHYLGRREYEIMAGDLWHNDTLEKIDIYAQIEMNLDRLAEYISREMRLFL